jgi:hypothetical protein
MSKCRDSTAPLRAALDSWFQQLELLLAQSPIIWPGQVAAWPGGAHQAASIGSLTDENHRNRFARRLQRLGCRRRWSQHLHGGDQLAANRERSFSSPTPRY